MNIKLGDKVKEKLGDVDAKRLTEHLTGVPFHNSLSRDPTNLETAVVKMGPEVWNLRHLTMGIHCRSSSATRRMAGPGGGARRCFR